MSTGGRWSTETACVHNTSFCVAWRIIRIRLKSYDTTSVCFYYNYINHFVLHRPVMWRVAAQGWFPVRCSRRKGKHSSREMWNWHQQVTGSNKLWIHGKKKVVIDISCKSSCCLTLPSEDERPDLKMSCQFEMPQIPNNLRILTIPRLIDSFKFKNHPNHPALFMYCKTRSLMSEELTDLLCCVMVTDWNVKTEYQDDSGLWVKANHWDPKW